MTALRSTALRTSFAYFTIVTASIFWAGNGIGSKILYRPDGAHFDAVSLFVARAAYSLPLFALLAIVWRPKFRPRRNDWLRMIATGLAFGPGACGFLALAAQYTSGAHIVLLMSLTPMLTAAIAALVLHERLEKPRIVALTLGIVGAVLLTTTRSSTGSSIAGDLLELVQVVALSIVYILIRRMGTRFSPFFLTGVYGSVGMLALALYGIAVGRFGRAVAMPLTTDTSTLWWFFGEIVIGLSIYGQVAQTIALRVLDAGTTSLVGSYATLIFGLAGAVWLLHESIAPSGIFAGLLLAVGLALALVPANRRD